MMAMMSSAYALRGEIKTVFSFFSVFLVGIFSQLSFFPTDGRRHKRAKVCSTVSSRLISCFLGRFVGQVALWVNLREGLGSRVFEENLESQ
jgi:hypothetical protein